MKVTDNQRYQYFVMQVCSPRDSDSECMTYILLNINISGFRIVFPHFTDLKKKNVQIKQNIH